MDLDAGTWFSLGESVERKIQVLTGDERYTLDVTDAHLGKAQEGLARSVDRLADTSDKK